MSLCKSYLIRAFSLAFLFSGCDVWQNVSDRVRVDRLIVSVSRFRDAEKEFSRNHGNGNCGSLDQLVATRLIETKFADGKEFGYRYDLVCEGSNYRLTVAPEENPVRSDSGEQLSLYVDQTGVIRASFDPHVLANSNSSGVAE